MNTNYTNIQVIYNRLVAFQKKSQKLSELPGFGGTDSYRSIMPNMLQIMNLKYMVIKLTGRSLCDKLKNLQLKKDIAYQVF